MPHKERPRSSALRYQLSRNHAARLAASPSVPSYRPPRLRKRWLVRARAHRRTRRPSTCPPLVDHFNPCVVTGVERYPDAERPVWVARAAVKGGVSRLFRRQQDQVIRDRAIGSYLLKVKADVPRLVDNAWIVAFKGNRLWCPGGLCSHGLAPPFVPAGSSVHVRMRA